ncbi:hypothetical protein [Bacillus mobilis]
MNNRGNKSKNIKRNKGLEKKYCRFCSKWKRLEHYAPTNSRCKECRVAYMRERTEQEIAEIGLAAHLLKKSCRTAFDRCSRKKKGYTDVECAWHNVNTMFEDLRNTKPFFSEWISQTEKYEKGGFVEGDRPTLDRIFNKGPYSLNNIQCLSAEENRIKDKKAGTNVFFTDENGVFSYSPYQTMTAAATDLNVGYSKLRKCRDIHRPVFVHGKVMFIQSDSKPKKKLKKVTQSTKKERK